MSGIGVEPCQAEGFLDTLGHEVKFLHTSCDCVAEDGALRLVHEKPLPVASSIAESRQDAGTQLGPDIDQVAPCLEVGWGLDGGCGRLGGGELDGAMRGLALEEGLVKKDVSARVVESAEQMHRLAHGVAFEDASGHCEGLEVGTAGLGSEGGQVGVRATGAGAVGARGPGDAGTVGGRRGQARGPGEAGGGIMLW